MKEKGNNGIKKLNEDVGQIISMGTLFVKIPEYCVVSLQLGNHLGYESENICCYPKYIENEKGRSLPILLCVDWQIFFIFL